MVALSGEPSLLRTARDDQSDHTGKRGQRRCNWLSSHMRAV